MLKALLKNKEALKKYNIKPITMLTSRFRREGEMYGTDYWFITSHKFMRLIADNHILAYTKFTVSNKDIAADAEIYYGISDTEFTDKKGQNYIIGEGNIELYKRFIENKRVTDKYNVIPIILSCDPFVLLQRSIKRSIKPYLSKKKYICSIKDRDLAGYMNKENISKEVCRRFISDIETINKELPNISNIHTIDTSNTKPKKVVEKLIEVIDMTYIPD